MPRSVLHMNRRILRCFEWPDARRSRMNAFTCVAISGTKRHALRIIRFVIGDPLIMKEMAKHVRRPWAL